MANTKGRREYGSPSFDRGVPVSEPEFNEENIQDISQKTGISEDDLKYVIGAKADQGDDLGRPPMSLG